MRPGRVLLALQDRPARTVNRMLPNFRFVIGAVLATALLAVTALGLFASVHATHQMNVGPLEASRNLVFDDRTVWNQFNDPEAARRFMELMRRLAPADEPAETAADQAAPPTPPAVATAPEAPVPAAPEIEPGHHDHASDDAAPAEPAPATQPDPVASATAAERPRSEAPAPATPAESSAPPLAATPKPGTVAADEPGETGTLPPIATALAKASDEKASDQKSADEPSWDEEPLMVEEAPDAPGAERVVTAPAGASETDASKSEATLPAPTEPAMPNAPAPAPAAPPAAVSPAPARAPRPTAVAPVRRAPPPRTVERNVEPDEEPAPRRAPAPKPRVARPAPQAAPQHHGQPSYGDGFSRQPYGTYSPQQQYAPRQQYAPQQQYAPRQPQRDPYAQPYGSRSNWQYGG
jgi:hypothetical protein